MSAIDLDYLRGWIGKTETRYDSLSARHGRLMAATLDCPAERCQPGLAMPPLWHWSYFLDAVPENALGPDGHPARGGFLPPVPLPNRMWAGGTLEFHASLPFGAALERRSSVVGIEHKRGRSGELVFVTVLHEIIHDNKVALSEHHDIVYKEAGAPGGAAVEIALDLAPAAHSKTYHPNSTTLFRYSALTFNGHRIHYDADYCRNVEGYANLVIHGPLNATQLAGFAEQVAGKTLRRFRYRGLGAAILGVPLTLNAAPEDAGLRLWISRPDGSLSMQAHAQF
jgi:3-methylfumaryl-CoA hydratase